MEFRVLGPVRVERDGVPVELGRRRERCLLGVLVLEANATVPTERLVELLWDDEPPRDSRGALRIHVSRLRAALDPGGAGGGIELVHTGVGYVARVDPAAVDALRFRELVGRARDERDPVRRAALLREALGLWRGEPLADAASDAVRQRIAAGWLEARASALEELMEAELAAGRHREVLEELSTLGAEHPYRERFTGLLMTALYRCGRRAEALDAYARLDRLVRDELGLDPGPELRELHRRVLAGELERVEAPAARNDLPGDLPDFVGRRAELDALLADPAGTVTVCAIDGMAGVGKTTLAIHAAHRLADRYPDGQLYVDLHGSTPGQPPDDPGAVLDHLLDTIGVPRARVPGPLDLRAALWRAQLAGRRLLLVLDNAADPAQVRPLLPGGAGCLALITSRQRLSDVDTAVTVSLDPLGADDGLGLLRAVIGPRLDTEPEPAAAVVTRCGGLPLALRIAGTRLRARPGWSVAYLADRLAEQNRGGGELSGGIATAFGVSYQHLGEDLRALFRLLGVAPGRSVDPYAAAALAGTSRAEAEDRLERLVDAHLITEPAPGRYEFHDLMRAHARATAGREVPPAERRAALDRVTRYYLHAAAAANGFLGPAWSRVLPPGAAPEELPAFGDADAAYGWCLAECDNLLALIPRAGALTWPLGVATWGFFNRYGGRRQGWAAAQDALLAAAPDAQGRARVFNRRAIAEWAAGRLTDAVTSFERACAQYRAAADGHGEALAHDNLGIAYAKTGEPERGRRESEAALALHSELGDLAGTASVLNNLVVAHDRAGEHAAALECGERALDACERAAAATADPVELRKITSGWASSYDSVATVYLHLGEPAAALERFRRAVELFTEVGDVAWAAMAASGAGEAYRLLGQPDRALAEQERALAVVTEHEELEFQVRVLLNTGNAHASLGATDRAVASYREALALATDLGFRWEEERVREALRAAGTA